MFRIETYINDLIAELKNVFGKRLQYVGLQDSYLRDEAHDKNDIDIMVVIDDLIVSDLDNYQNTLVKIGYYERACGFICGKDELANWNPLEICQILHTTKDYYGQLKLLVPQYTLDDERNYIKLSIGNLYHELCHRYIHSDRENNITKLPITSKSVFFIIQNMYYLNTRVFIVTKKNLLQCVRGEDKQVLELAPKLCESAYDFDEAFTVLFDWCKSALNRVRNTAGTRACKANF